jgi:hypothetical protein
MNASKYLKLFGRRFKSRPSVGMKVALALVIVSSLAITAIGVVAWGGLSLASHVIGRLDLVGGVAQSTEAVVQESKGRWAQVDITSCGQKLETMADIALWTSVPLKENLVSIKRACFGPDRLECAKDLSCDESKSIKEGVSA